MPTKTVACPHCGEKFDIIGVAHFQPEPGKATYCGRRESLSLRTTPLEADVTCIDCKNALARFPYSVAQR